MSDVADLARRLRVALRLGAPPIAIRFEPRDGEAAPAFGGSAPAPNEAGRTGTAPAGCVFWMRAAERTFATTAADHANCSVGSLTHGWIDLAEAASRDDVAAVLAAGWVEDAAVASLPRVRERPASIVYGPLAEATSVPDVVLVRIDGLALMTLHGAVSDLRIEGRPQCHVVALAKESGAVAASVGCALSRARTGMPPSEMTCAIAGARLRDVVERIEATAALDKLMASYAAGDARRFER
jgi:uncharacterized protein (DUF169 family)